LITIWIAYVAICFCPLLAPLFRALCQEQNASPYFSTASALFAQNTGVYPSSHLSPAANGQRLAPNAPFATSATISKSVSAEKQARRFFVSGLVQGVGFRYFAQDAAERLHLAGYVRNLRDGRVEAYAIGSEDRLARFLAVLKKGPHGATVHGVVEESAALDSQYENEFSITHDI